MQTKSFNNWGYAYKRRLVICMRTKSFNDYFHVKPYKGYQWVIQKGEPNETTYEITFMSLHHVYFRRLP